MKLIGRTDQISEIVALIADPAVRLVTLTGPAGVGKTALAEAVMHTLRECGEEVEIVTFASVPDTIRATNHLGKALGITPAEAESWETSIVTALTHRTLVLALDNLEHLTPFPVVSRILDECPGVTLLVTTRGLLQLSDEVLYQVPPLAVPESFDHVSVDSLAQIASVQLLVERAKRVTSSFALTAENAADIARLCIALDGLPLAIELTAARLNMFSPRTLCERLGDRFAFLVGGPLDRPEHQRALRSAIAWSYELLGVAEQGPFYRMAAFTAPVSPEAAAYVCEASFEQLMALSDRNLIHMRSGDGCTVSMLETMRLFAMEKLADSGERDATMRRLAEWCLAESRRLGAGLIGHDQPEALAQLDALMPNIHAALKHLLENNAANEYAALACSLFRYWRIRGLLSEADYILRQCLQERWREHIQHPLRAEALAMAAFIVYERGDADQATTFAEEAISLAQPINEYRTMGQAWRVLALVDSRQDQPARARQRMEQSLRWYREANDDDGIAGSLNNLAILALDDGTWQQVVSLCEESAARFTALGNIHGASHSLDTMGIAQYELHRYGDAMRSTMASLQIDRSVGDTRGLAVTLDHVGKIARAMGDLPAAWRAHAESLTYRRNVGDPRGLMVWLQAMAHWLVVAGRAELSARVIGAVDFARTSMALPIQTHELQDHRITLELGERAIGSAAWNSNLAKGRWQSFDDLIEEIIATAEAVVSDLHAGVPLVRDGLAVTYGLTARETEILHMLALRLSDREIADRLCISARTVNRHVGNILMKLDVRSRREAAEIGARQQNG